MQPIAPFEADNQDWESDPLVESIMKTGPATLRKGDIIRVLTLDGKRRYVKLSEVRPDAILVKSSFSKEKKISSREIVFLEKRTNKWGNLWSLFPLLKESKPDDETLTLSQIKDELSRVDVLRRAINKEILALEWEMANAVLALQLQDLPQKQLDRNENSRDSANARMIQLLDLWRGKSASDGLLPGGESVQDILDKIEELNFKEAAGKLEGFYDYQLKKTLNKVISK